VTSRPKGEYETDGELFWFLSEEELVSSLDKDEFMEVTDPAVRRLGPSRERGVRRFFRSFQPTYLGLLSWTKFLCCFGGLIVRYDKIKLISNLTHSTNTPSLVSLKGQ